MASDLKPGEMALGAIVGIFHQYASGDGDSKTLSKKEFDVLVEEQFPNLIPGECASQLKDEMQKIAGDTIDFQEFMNLVILLCVMAHCKLLESLGGKNSL